jgi:cytochrome P450
MTELLLQKQADRFEVYNRPPGLWLSPGRKRWMVTSPNLIREVMTSDAFAVPTYDVSRLSERLNIDLSFLNELRNWIPLAHEGERHRYLRASFARAIASRTEPALEILHQALEGARSLFTRPSGSEFCLFETLFRPALRQAIGGLSDVDVPADLAVEVIPQLFDDTISLTRRRKINAVLEVVSKCMPDSLSEEDRQTRMAIIALSANTLLGSICQTFIEQLKGSPGKPLSGVDWGREMKRTALPLVEKRVVKPVQLGGQSLMPGDRVRLFIEAAGFTAQGQCRYDDLFFAVGAHKCVGMNFSVRAWQAVADYLSSVDRIVKVVDVRERDGDYVFNLPERILVKLDE